MESSPGLLGAMKFATVVALGVLIAASPAEEAVAKVLDVTCSITSRKQTYLKEEKETVADWSVELANHSKESRWVSTVTAPFISPYLKERNPLKISYRILMLRGSKWEDSYRGYSMVIGPDNKWEEIKPGASLKFVAPLINPKGPLPATLRLDFDVATKPDAKDAKVLSSDKIRFDGVAAEPR